MAAECIEQTSARTEDVALHVCAKRNKHLRTLERRVPAGYRPYTQPEGLSPLR